MEDTSGRKIGSICSLLLGISYLMIAVAVWFDPLRHVTTRSEFWSLYPTDSTLRLTTHAIFIVGSIIALAVVPAISQLVRQGNEELVRWMVNIAYLGFAVTALSKAWEFSIQPLIAETYVAGDQIMQTAIIATPQINLDGVGWLRFGCLGTWMIVINILAYRSFAWPRTLAVLGILGGILYWLVPIGNSFNLEFALFMEVVVAILGGAIVGPIWFLWMSFVLRRPERPTPMIKKPQVVPQ